MDLLRKRLKECRIWKDLTLLEVANMLGVKEATVQRYESGEIKNIKHDTIAQLAEIYDVSPAYLMGWQEEKEKSPSIEELIEGDEQMQSICQKLYGASLEKKLEVLNFVDYVLSRKAPGE